MSPRGNMILNRGIRFDTSFYKGGDRDFGHQVLNQGLKVGYAGKSVVLHKWSTSLKTYFRMRFESGVAKYELQQKSGPANYKRQTRKAGLFFILKLAYEKSHGLPFWKKCLFLIFIFIGQLFNIFAFYKTKYLGSANTTP